MGKTLRIQNWRMLLLGWLLPALGVASWVLEWLHQGDPLLPWIFAIFGVFAATCISVIAHELAHFIVAKALGLEPFFLSIGTGETVFKHQFRTFRLRLRSNPYSGIVYQSLPTGGRAKRRSDRFWVLLAGPSTNAAIFGISFYLAFIRPTASGPAQFVRSPIPFEMLLANGWLFLTSIVPFWRTRAGIRLHSDGMQLLLLAFRPKGKSRKRRSRAGSVTSEPDTVGRWHEMVKEFPHELPLAAYRQQLEDSSLSDEERNQALDGFATCVLMYGVLEFLPEADRYSEELMRNKPDEWTVKGTRGGILVEKGDLPAGIAMLTQVMDNDPSVFDRAISASFLALAEWKKNNKDAAESWLHRSFELDPNCVSALRVAEIVRNNVASSR